MGYRSSTRYKGVYERHSQKQSSAGKHDVCFDICYRSDGKLVWEKVGWQSEGYSAKLASDIRSERLRTIRHGEELPQQKKKAPFFSDLATSYLKWAATNKSREGRDDRYLYNNHLASRFDGKRLNEIASLDLEQMKADLSKKGLAPATVKHCLVLLRQIYNKAVLWSLYNGPNPIKGVKMPVLKNDRQRFLSPEEADALLKKLSAYNSPLCDMALLSLHCGLRAGEIFNLKGSDLDFDNALINISDPKNKERRQAYMTMTVKAMLDRRKPDKPEGYVFKDRRHGGKIDAISKTFREAVAELRLNESIKDTRKLITFHSLRHTFASWLALQGESLLTIKEMLGHKTLTMTQRYAHLTPDHKKTASYKLERQFFDRIASKKEEIQSA